MGYTVAEYHANVLASSARALARQGILTICTHTHSRIHTCHTENTRTHAHTYTRNTTRKQTKTIHVTKRKLLTTIETDLKKFYAMLPGPLSRKLRPVTRT